METIEYEGRDALLFRQPLGDWAYMWYACIWKKSKDPTLKYPDWKSIEVIDEWIQPVGADIDGGRTACGVSDDLHRIPAGGHAVAVVAVPAPGAAAQGHRPGGGPTGCRTGGVGRVSSDCPGGLLRQYTGPAVLGESGLPPRRPCEDRRGAADDTGAVQRTVSAEALLLFLKE